jgi:predicted nucleic acid binding AN1-type Zn finger protein
MDNQQIYNDFTNCINSLKINNFDLIINSNSNKVINEININPIQETKNDNKPQNFKKIRCAICKVKINTVDIIISNCKCNKNHCAKHRMPESHNCDQIDNIKETQKKNLEISLIKLESNKLERL